MSQSACTICGKPSTSEHTPFCSKRCREIDLNRWFTGAYAVPAVEMDDLDEEQIEQALAKPEGF